MSYRLWSWKKDSYEFKKSYRYKNDIKNEIEYEIIKINDDKRAECSKRIASREGVIQRNINPFLNSDYITDLEMQDNFLRPKDSNIDK
tara:strand:- start:357 stop:620 length:264 start_codon:yes stop_codon:yes gene_type:complete